MSSYAKTIQRRNQSAEDKIIDDNYSNGLITTEAYIDNLNNRSTRAYLTPLQRTNLQIKIRDTQEKYQDEQIQTAYKNGGFMNGQRVDDNFLLSYEKEKMDKMAPGSTAYEQQSQKVATLTDKIQRDARRQFRIDTELELARTPDYDFNTMRKKQEMYQELQAQAEQDGDIEQAQQFALNATKYKNSADKAEEDFNVRNKTQEIRQDAFDRTNTPAEQPSAPGIPANAPQPAVPGQAPMGPSMEEVAPEEQGPQTLLEKLQNVDWFDPKDFYEQDDIDYINKQNESVENKKKALQKMEIEYEKQNKLFDEYFAASSRATDPDQRDKYWNQAQAAANEANRIFNSMQEKETEIDDSVNNVVDNILKRNENVSNRIFNNAKNEMERDKAQLDEELQNGTIDKETYIRANAKYVEDKLNFFGTQKAVFSDVYDNQEKVVNIDTDIAKVNSEVIETEAQLSNPSVYEPIIDGKTGKVELKNMIDTKTESTKDGKSKFDVLYQKVGNAYTKLEYRDGDEVLDDSEVLKKSDKQISKLTKHGVIFENIIKEEVKDGKVVAERPVRERRLTEFDKNGNPTNFSRINEDGSISKYTEIPIQEAGAKKEGFLNKVGNFFKGAVKSFGDTLNKDREMKTQFIRSVVGEPVQKVGAELRSAITPQPVYAQTIGNAPQLVGVPQEYQAKILETAQKYGVRPELIAGVLKQESNFDPNADNGQDRGMGQINRQWNPDVTDEQAFDPNFAIDFVGKNISNLTKQTGSEYDAIRAYNGGAGGYKSQSISWDGKRTVDQTTREYADSIFERSKKFTTAPRPENNIVADTKGLRSNLSMDEALGRVYVPRSKGLVATPLGGTARSRSEEAKERGIETPEMKMNSPKLPSQPTLRSKVQKTVDTVKKVSDFSRDPGKVIQQEAKKTVVNNLPKIVDTGLKIAKTYNTAKQVVNTVKSKVTGFVDETKKKASNFVSGIKSFFGRK